MTPARSALVSEGVESRIAAYLNLLAPELVVERQYRFLYPRRFRADIAIPAARVVIEYNGGTWSSAPSHASGKGIARDAEKVNLAQLSGWAIFLLTADMIEGTAIMSAMEPIIAFARQRVGTVVP